ncbi:MAG: hypothetical protein JNM00_04720 [Flavobacteriales bacterium]|nr:hypothetical protein [Flavobacteriales bacterium]
MSEKNCELFSGEYSFASGIFGWTHSVFYAGTDSMYVIQASDATDRFELELLQNNPGKSRLRRTLFYLRQGNIEIMRFHVICEDYSHLQNWDTGLLNDGYIYYYNSENELFEYRRMTLDSLKIRYPFPDADNIYERID